MASDTFSPQEIALPLTAGAIGKYRPFLKNSLNLLRSFSTLPRTEFGSSHRRFCYTILWKLEKYQLGLYGLRWYVCPLFHAGKWPLSLTASQSTRWLPVKISFWFSPQVPETYAATILRKRARILTKQTGICHVAVQDQNKQTVSVPQQVKRYLFRPFEFLFFECVCKPKSSQEDYNSNHACLRPIVLLLSSYSTYQLRISWFYDNTHFPGS